MKPNRHLPETVAMFGSLVCENADTDKKTAIKLAELVLPIYENDCPNDDRPRKAVAAAKTYLASPTDENLQFLAKARTAVSSAADSAAPMPFHAARRVVVHATYDGTSNATYYNSSANAAYCAAYVLKIKQIEIKQNDVLKSALNSDSWVKLC